MAKERVAIPLVIIVVELENHDGDNVINIKK
jgi:hypothetical protein